MESGAAMGGDSATAQARSCEVCGTAATDDRSVCTACGAQLGAAVPTGSRPPVEPTNVMTIPGAGQPADRPSTPAPSAPGEAERPHFTPAGLPTRRPRSGRRRRGRAGRLHPVLGGIVRRGPGGQPGAAEAVRVHPAEAGAGAEPAADHRRLHPRHDARPRLGRRGGAPGRHRPPTRPRPPEPPSPGPFPAPVPVPPGPAPDPVPPDPVPPPADTRPDPVAPAEPAAALAQPDPARAGAATAHHGQAAAARRLPGWPPAGAGDRHRPGAEVADPGRPPRRREPSTVDRPASRPRPTPTPRSSSRGR